MKRRGVEKRKTKSPRKPKTELYDTGRIERWLAKASEQLMDDDFEGVIRTCKRALRHARSAKQRSWALEHMGIALARQHHYDAAYEALSRALEEEPAQPTLWLNRGITARYVMRMGRSVRDLEQALALSQGGALSAQCADELAFSRRLAEDDRAMRGPDFTLDELIEQQELFHQGIDLMENQQWDEAARLFRRVIAMGDCLPQPWGNLGGCLLMEKRYDEAEEALQRAIALDPQYIFARANLATLEQSRRAGTRPRTLRMYHPFDGPSVPEAHRWMAK